MEFLAAKDESAEWGFLVPWKKPTDKETDRFFEGIGFVLILLIVTSAIGWFIQTQWKKNKARIAVIYFIGWFKQLFRKK